MACFSKGNKAYFGFFSLDKFDNEGLYKGVGFFRGKTINFIRKYRLFEDFKEDDFDNNGLYVGEYNDQGELDMKNYKNKWYGMTVEEINVELVHFGKFDMGNFDSNGFYNGKGYFRGKDIIEIKRYRIFNDTYKKADFENEVYVKGGEFNGLCIEEINAVLSRESEKNWLNDKLLKICIEEMNDILSLEREEKQLYDELLKMCIEEINTVLSREREKNWLNDKLLICRNSGYQMSDKEIMSFEEAVSLHNLLMKSSYFLSVFSFYRYLVFLNEVLVLFIGIILIFLNEILVLLIK